MNKALNLLLISFLTLSLTGQSINLKTKGDIQMKKSGFKNINLSLSERFSKPGKIESGNVEKQQLDSIISQTWDRENNEWILSSKEIYAYNEISKNILETRSIWNLMLNQWVNEYKSEFTYYSDGNIKEFLHCYWDEGDSTWVYNGKELLTYNMNRKRENYFLFELNESSGLWDTAYKANYYYNAGSNNTSVISLQLDDLSNKWDTVSKTEYYSNEHSNDTLQIYYSQDDSSGLWFPSMKVEYIYDSNGNNTEYYWYLAKDSARTLSPVSKVEYTFDELNNWDDIYSYEWNGADNIWQITDKSKVTYDYSYSNDDFVLPYFYSGYNFNSMFFQSISYTYNGEGWDKEDITTFYFSVPLAITNINSNQAIQRVTVFPNPASESIKINLGSDNGNIELFDLQGRQVLNHELFNETTISIQNLNNGVYFYRIESSNGLSTGKLIIKK